MAVMMMRRGFLRFCIVVLYLCLAARSFYPCDARRSMELLKAARHPTNSITKSTMKPNAVVVNHMGINPLLDSSNARPYGVSSPFSLPPFDSLAPIPLPENAPPYCIYPPATPQAPSTTINPAPFSVSPILPTLSPPSSPMGQVPGPPEYNPTPSPSPFGTVPTPSGNIPSPPSAVLTPPYIEPSPPGFGSSPPFYVPSPPVFQPPVVYPPPTGPPRPKTGPALTLWCVAKPSVPEPIIQEAMDYACASGADCNSIQPSGSCYEPNTSLAHASFAFNSYWQRSKVAGGTCEFGGTAMLVSVDPSYDGCHFMFA